ncbi:cytochrome P450 81Q32-like [Rutidosis leptorrhynchoides]|uniref:cytochrome P450 81Q32-like n=1 Tax=Rutidosis leptorrhynchoides TaxID=125765 RepID=UPI003A98E427
MVPFYVILSIVAFIWITKIVLEKNKNLPPSPFPCLPIVGHLYLVKSPLYRALGKLSNRYGPVLMLQFGSRKTLLVSSPDAIEECLTTNDIAFANRPHLLAGKHLGYDYTTIAWSSYGDHWRNLRRIAILELLSAHRLQTLNSVREEEVRLLAKRVYESAIKCNGIVEMKSMFFELMLNVLMMMIAGKRYYGDSVLDVQEGQRFKEIVKETFGLMETTNVSDYLPWWKWLGGRALEKKFVDLRGKRDMFMQGLLDEHKQKLICGSEEEREIEKKDEKKNLIQVMLMLQEKEPKYYEDQLIKGLMQVLLSAGTDTSSGTMEWMLSHLLNNPEALKKGQDEIDNYVGEDRLLNESDISNLPYLRCIINETMRMTPAGPLVFHESRKDCTVGGYHVPSGTMLLMNVWAMHNDPKNWEEAKKFKPERFIGLEGSTIGYKLMPFGAGRRRCPAENLAMRMVGLALGTLIQCFDWERTSDEMIDMTEGTGLTMPRAKPLVAKCQPRKKMAKLLF